MDAGPNHCLNCKEMLNPSGYSKCTVGEKKVSVYSSDNTTFKLNCFNILQFKAKFANYIKAGPLEMNNLLVRVRMNL